MRHTQAFAHLRRIAFAAAAALAAGAVFPGHAEAQDKFERLYIFGDSYTDVQLAGLWRVYPLPLAENLGNLPIVEFGVGGARASPFGPPAVVAPGWHLPQQVDAYLATGNAITTRDLVTLNIGGNDALAILNGLGAGVGYPAGPITPANVATFANITATFAADQIQRLVDSGAKNFILGEFSGLSGLPVVPAFAAPVADAFGRAYFDAMQAKLAPIAAATGARFFMFDLFALGTAVDADIKAGGTKYGFTGFLCPGGGSVCGGAVNSPQQTQFYIGPDGLHLTSGGFALVADYMANIVEAPGTIAVQPDIAKAATSAFTTATLNRLDANREHNFAGRYRNNGGPNGAMNLGAGEEAASRLGGPREGSIAASRLTVYSAGIYASGQRDSPSAASHDYETGAGTIGIEYRATRNLLMGLAGNYANTHADLNSGANVDGDALQVAAYLSYTDRHWFGDALVSFGRHDLDLARPGVIDTIRSSTDATSFSAAARGGYLFDFGRLRAGPIAGLSYLHVDVDGYTEKGDPLLTFSVANHSLHTLAANIGVQFRAPIITSTGVISPYLNVMLEHQFGDATRSFTTSLTQAPLLPIPTDVQTFDTRTYGKLEAGVTFDVNSSLSATIAGATTFARDEGNEFVLSAGLNVRF